MSYITKKRKTINNDSLVEEFGEDVDIDFGGEIAFKQGDIILPDSGFTNTLITDTLAGDVTTTLPGASGTVALTLDIPTDHVDLGSVQTITGAKTFEDFNLPNSGFANTLVSDTLAGDVTTTLPSTSGTVALTSDLANLMDLSSTQTATGIKTFENIFISDGAGNTSELRQGNNFLSFDLDGASSSQAIFNGQVIASNGFVNKPGFGFGGSTLSGMWYDGAGAAVAFSKSSTEFLRGTSTGVTVSGTLSAGATDITGTLSAGATDITGTLSAGATDITGTLDATSIEINSGGVISTFRSGTWTPSYSSLSNVTSVSTVNARYMIVNQLVTCHITVLLDVITSNTPYSFRFTNPFATTSGFNAAAGSIQRDTNGGANNSGTIVPIATSSILSLAYGLSSNGNILEYSINYTYSLIGK